MPIKRKPASGQLLAAALGVREMAVAAVDDDVAFIQQGFQLIDHRIHRGAGFDHDNNPARALQAGHEILDGVAGDDIFALGARLGEISGLLGRPVEHGRAEPVALDVQYEVFAHDGESDQPDSGFFHDKAPLFTC